MAEAGASTLYLGHKTPNYDYYGYLDEVRIVKGYGQWYESFTTPTSPHISNDEQFKLVSLPPGLVFEALTFDNKPLNSSLDICYGQEERTPFTIPPAFDHIIWSNGLPSVTSSITINRGGMKGAGTAGDIPRTYRFIGAGVMELLRNP